MTVHVPDDGWWPGEPISDRLVEEAAQAVIANKSHAISPKRYLPAAYGLFTYGDKLIFTVACILEVGRDDEEVRMVAIAAVATGAVETKKVEEVEKTLRAVIARVIELEKS